MRDILMRQLYGIPEPSKTVDDGQEIPRGRGDESRNRKSWRDRHDDDDGGDRRRSRDEHRYRNERRQRRRRSSPYDDADDSDDDGRMVNNRTNDNNHKRRRSITPDRYGYRSHNNHSSRRRVRDRSPPRSYRDRDANARNTYK